MSLPVVFTLVCALVGGFNTAAPDLTSGGGVVVEQKDASPVPSRSRGSGDAGGSCSNDDDISSASSFRFHHHAFAADQLTGAAMRCAVYSGAALKADAHAAERGSRFAGDRAATRHAGLEKRGGDYRFGLHLHRQYR